MAAGALASVTSAIVASRFGVGGTLVGAGLASVVSTTGATVYSHVLRRTGSKARGVLEELPRHAHHSIRRADGEQASQEPAPRDDDPAPAPTTAVATPPPPDQEAGAAPGGGRSRRLPVWAVVPVAACILVFAIALGAISVVEAMTGRPAASWVGGSSPSSGTTVGSVVGGNSVRTPAGTQGGTPAPTPVSTPASSVAPAVPTQEPGTPSVAQPSAPAVGPSQAASAAPSSLPQATPTPIPNNAATPAGGG